METTFTKLRDGSWGLRALGPITPGQRVTVTRKDGTTSPQVVGTILWTGGGVTLATIAAPAPTPAPAKARKARKPRKRKSEESEESEAAAAAASIEI